MGRNDKNICETHIIGPSCVERFLPLSQPWAGTLRTLEVSLAGISDLGPDYAMGRPRPSFHAVVLTLSGQGHVTVDGNRFRLRPQEILVLPRGKPHTYRSSRGGWRILWWHHRPFGLWEHLIASGVQHRPALEAGMLTESFEGVLREAPQNRGEETDTSRTEASRAYAQLAAIAIQREIGKVQPAPEDELSQRLRKLWCEVDGRLHEEWPMERLAQLAHCSIGHFHRRVRDLSGKTPAQMLLELRLRRAQALLAETTLPVYQIADAVGFRNPYAFSAAFRREIDRSPSEFRNKAKQS